MSVLAGRLLAIHVALERAGVRHAFGGAIALAYFTEEPRGTRDLDLNVFLPSDRADEALDAMPKGVAVRKTHRTAAKRDGQVRVMWDDTPVDLFFDTHEFHHAAAEAVVRVPFEGTTIPILAGHTLVVFKAMFNRTRDWADIEAVLETQAPIGEQALTILRSLLGAEDVRTLRLAELVGRARA
ncbi:MAG: hypothetical protein WDA27_09525 [Actinomycetota bacterium]